jgi:hypothetical protein
MPKFIVSVREVWIQPVAVEAKDKGEAIALVSEGDGDYLEDQLEYSDTRDPIEWTVNELDDDDDEWGGRECYTCLTKLYGKEMRCPECGAEQKPLNGPDDPDGM